MDICLHAKVKVREKQCLKILEKSTKRRLTSATHIVFAEKAVDDGEPSGTAGRPILNVLQKRDMKNVCVFVVRYFGGIKLGAGGLVRAYTKTTSLAVANDNH